MTKLQDLIDGICLCKIREKGHNSNDLLLKKKQCIKLTFRITSSYFDTVCQIWIDISMI